MSILVCSNVSMSYGTDIILDNITFAINEGDKVGVIGVNGAGKSTLFSIIRGRIDASGGDVFISNDTSIGCLEQINDAHRFKCNIYEAAVSAFEKLINLENEINSLRDRIENGDESVISSFVSATERFSLLGGNERRCLQNSDFPKKRTKTTLMI